MHRTIVVVDVEGFGDVRRTIPDQLAVRAGLYRALQHAFKQAGVPWAECDHEDRGDAVFVLAPAHLPKAPFVDAVPQALLNALREHNNTHGPEGRIRVRMAVHAGEVAYDEHGVTAAAVNLTFRLLDAEPLKTALAESPGILSLITSGWIFDEVVRHGRDTDPATFRPVQVMVKETSTVGWISLPDHPYPPDATKLIAPPPGHSVRPVPHQLPASPRLFTGRADDLAKLTATLDDSGQDGSTLVISAIGGAGGIGKTWLALRWAYEHLDHFPDGQLFVDLRGFSPDDEPMSPAVAVRGFLDGLGVAPDRVPVDLHARAGLFRSLVAGRRMLVVLDNAVDAAQVTPLLPGTPSCTVLVTSRNRLPGLITGNGAHHLALDVLPDAEARALLTAQLGAGRVDAEPAAIAELVRACSGFPLALSIVAARVHTYPHVPLTTLVAELREASLSVWEEADPAASLPAVFSWSYRRLTAEQARAFALLGIAPGPDISLPAATSLIGLPQPQVRAVLHGLEQASLVDQDGSGRYRMHDLIRQFATDRAHQNLTDTDRAAALRRVVDFYLHTAHSAERLLDPHRPPVQLAPLESGCRPQPLGDGAAALTWFDAEHTCLLAAQRAAATHGHYQAMWQLAYALTVFHSLRGHRRDRLAVWEAGLAAADHLDDRTAQTIAHGRLGHALGEVGRNDEGIDHLQQALTLARHSDNRPSQAHIHQALAGVWEQRGDNQQALEYATHALRLFRTIDNPAWEAAALNVVGWFAARVGDYDRAREHCQAALTLHRRNQVRAGEANSMDSLGYIAYLTGQHTQALAHYQQAIILYREVGNTYAAADTLDRHGHTHAALGQHEHAQAAWQEALELYRAQQRFEDADRVQQQLVFGVNSDGHSSGVVRRWW